MKVCNLSFKYRVKYILKLEGRRVAGAGKL
jgi:hypothetical protein